MVKGEFINSEYVPHINYFKPELDAICQILARGIQYPQIFTKNSHLFHFFEKKNLIFFF